jgi:hypothetical protein
MRPKTPEVLAGLQQYANGELSAVRSKDLAVRIGLPSKVVSNALNWLALESKNPDVRRGKAQGGHWYRYWWAGQ